MTKRIFRAIMLVAGIILLSSLLIIMDCLYEYFASLQENELKDQLSLAAAGVEQGGEEYLARVNSERYRLTWIAPDGTVKYDSGSDKSTLDNHAAREEVRQALEAGEGQSTRYSATLMQKTMYYAKRLDDGSVIRISVSRATIATLALGMLRPVVIIVLAALVLATIMANRLAQKIVAPLNALDLDHPLDNDAYEEIAPLLSRINRQHMQINAQMRALDKKKDEFNAITRSMNEGLVLLDEKGSIISINPAARQLFNAEENCAGHDFITVDRNPKLSEAIHAAYDGGRGETSMSRGGKVYQLDVSRIESDGKTIGAVILGFDITEKQNADAMRREFTANVSHELKTPLQGIIGSAELIENGMVKAEDMPRFVGHIRQEAQRLVTLIGDIIRLSQLDEGCDMPTERVDLKAVAAEAASDLRTEAEEKRVSVSVQGDSVYLTGVRRLLYEIIYNLCDNAVKYNRDGGSVSITVGEKDGLATVTVADTGIGIPEEHQARVFERFYRVDKSHSKESGGTGLGLSIVKHAVMYHHGSIRLESVPNVGTTVTVSLPA